MAQDKPAKIVDITPNDFLQILKSATPVRIIASENVEFGFDIIFSDNTIVSLETGDRYGVAEILFSKTI